jgi:hypothetical protein
VTKRTNEISPKANPFVDRAILYFLQQISLILIKNALRIKEIRFENGGFELKLRKSKEEKEELKQKQNERASKRAVCADRV